MYEESVRHTIKAEGIGKRFDDLWALRDLDLDVPAGSVLGLLGHNGAGKTTAIRILTTLSAPSEGRAQVAGFDVVADALNVRRSIGVAAQQATVDGLLTARANLEMVARLHDVPKAQARREAGDLLDRLDLADVGDKLAKQFSGGMRRRLDLAATLVGHPSVLFLDEPTTGLDPRSRGDLWDLLRELVREGTTIVLTTQYLEEADRLADDIVVLDHGLAIAQGTPRELKARVGDDRVDVTVGSPHAIAAAEQALAAFTDRAPSVDLDLLQVSIPVRDGVTLMDMMRALGTAAGVDATDLGRRQATLDDVFLSLTSNVPQRARPSTTIKSEVLA